MAIGFRKSLFGFNCDDVINYVKKLHANYAEKEANFKEQLDEFQNKIDILNKEQQALQAEKVQLSNKISEYEAKSAEVERLSENIGKLYLVAQTNAKTIMNNAEENSRISSEEVNKNLTTITETHAALQELRESIAATSANFTKEINQLMESLNTTKEKILSDNEESENSKTEFDVVFQSLTK